EQSLLAFDADLVEQDVPAVAQQVVVLHRGRGYPGVPARGRVESTMNARRAGTRARATQMAKRPHGAGVACGLRGGRSVGLRVFGLALDLGLRDDDRLALEAIERLLQREVLAAAELGQRLRPGLGVGRGGLLELLDGFVARLVAVRVL